MQIQVLQHFWNGFNWETVVRFTVVIDENDMIEKVKPDTNAEDILAYMKAEWKHLPDAWCPGDVFALKSYCNRRFFSRNDEELIFTA